MPLPIPPTGTTGITATYFAGGTPTTLDPSLALADPGSATLSGATVTIGSPFLFSDKLAVDTTGTAITARYDRVHGVLTLSGSDTVANYQAVLDRVTYSSEASDPAAGGSAPTPM